MFRRGAVVVSALAIVAAFVAAPFDHIHTSSALRHTHLNSHASEHQHGAPDTSDRSRHGAEDVLDATTFLAPGAGATVSLDAVIASPGVAETVVLTRHGAGRDEPRAHAPPARPRSPRAPPTLPAF